jgi:hypothetical protein
MHTPNTAPKLVFLDTCVLLEDPDVIERVAGKNGLPVLSTVVLKELDGFKSGSDARARNAREAFRKLGTNSRDLTILNGTTPLKYGDFARLFGTNGESIIVIDRKTYRDGLSNDDRIIDVAQSYDMILLSRDRAMIARAQAQGAQAVFWESRQGAQPPHRIRPFAIVSQPATSSEAELSVGQIPGAQETVVDSAGKLIRLGERLGGGGEGTIYATNVSGQVAKIYERRCLTSRKRAKVELMLTRSIDRKGICWPTSLLNNQNGEFVGYLMPRADGRTIQSSMFVKPLLEKTFPQWKRVDLVNVAIAFLEHMDFLHSLNVIVGDINPLNLLVLPSSADVSIVDTDSFQIEGFPCPVGTVNFTPARRQGAAYTDYLRTKDDELFAIATMLFMILHPGKPPYAQQGGGTPSENIRNKEFAYWFKTKDGAIYAADKAPEGPWQTIWANIPWDLRGAFHRCFREDSLVSISEWLRMMRKYRSDLASGRHSNELFPKSFPVRDPTNETCARCRKDFVGSKRQIESRKLKGFDPWCPDCFTESKLRKLANKTRSDGLKNASKPGAGSKPVLPGSRTGPTVRPASQARPKPPPRHSQQPSASSGSGLLKAAAIIGAGLAALFGLS